MSVYECVSVLCEFVCVCMFCVFTHVQVCALCVCVCMCIHLYIHRFVCTPVQRGKAMPAHDSH